MAKPDSCGGRWGECDACGEPVGKQSANEERTADVFPESSDPAVEQAPGDSISNTFSEPAVADTWSQRTQSGARRAWCCKSRRPLRL